METGSNLKKNFGADHLTDLGLGKRLVALHGRDIHYCYKSKKWWYFDGRRWVEDSIGEIDRRAKDIPKILYKEAANTEDVEKRKAISKCAQSSESEARRKAFIASAQSEPGVHILPENFDRDPWLLNCLNGTVDLRTGKLKPHDREDFITKLVQVEYHLGATYPLWQEFLNQIMARNQRLIDYIQRAVGYSLTEETIEQITLFLWGLGANGKTVLIETFKALLNDYAQSVPVETLMIKKNRDVPNDIARLRGVRLACASESEAGQKLAEALIKQTTEGDKIPARFLFQEYFEFTPTHKLWFVTNHKPIIRGTDYAIWRRIQLIPFTVQIPPEKQDRNLTQKLKNELPGILAWAVQGCLKWQAEGLNPPDDVKVATGSYRDEMDFLAEFIQERCLTNSSSKVRVKDLHQAYLAWAYEQDEKGLITQREFAKRIEERGIEKREDSGGVYFFYGIGLKG